MLAFLLLLAFSLEVEVSKYDVTIFQDAKGHTYAQVSSLLLARHLKVPLGAIIASTKEGLSCAQVIQKGIEALKGAPGGYAKWIKGCGNVLIKRGVYDLGKEGLQIPWMAHLVIEGEGWDTNFPERWKAISPRACPATYLVYRGSGKAISHAEKYCPATFIEFRNLTIVLYSGAEYGLFIPTHCEIRLDRIAVLTKMPSGTGIHAASPAGNVCYFTNLFVVGPFEVALDSPNDWNTIVNFVAMGFRGVGLKFSGSNPVIGGLLKGGGQR